MASVLSIWTIWWDSFLSTHQRVCNAAERFNTKSPTDLYHLMLYLLHFREVNDAHSTPSGRKALQHLIDLFHWFYKLHALYDCRLFSVFKSLCFASTLSNQSTLSTKKPSPPLHLLLVTPNHFSVSYFSHNCPGQGHTALIANSYTQFGCTWQFWKHSEL